MQVQVPNPDVVGTTISYGTNTPSEPEPTFFELLTTPGLPHLAVAALVALVWFLIVRPRRRVPGAAD